MSEFTWVDYPQQRAAKTFSHHIWNEWSVFFFICVYPWLGKYIRSYGKVYQWAAATNICVFECVSISPIFAINSRIAKRREQKKREEKQQQQKKNKQIRHNTTERERKKGGEKKSTRTTSQNAWLFIISCRNVRSLCSGLWGLVCGATTATDPLSCAGRVSQQNRTVHLFGHTKL